MVRFKRALEAQNAEGKVRRVKIITDRLGRKVEEILSRGRRERDERLKAEEEEEEEATRRRERESQQQPGESASKEDDGAAALGETRAAAEETGRRGVSNLPAWMTKGTEAAGGGEGGGGGAPSVAADGAAPDADGNDDEQRKRKFVPSEANREPNARRTRLDVEGGGGPSSLSEIRAANEAADAAAAASSEGKFVARKSKEDVLADGSKFPPFSDADDGAVSTLRGYVASRIVEYLGEEEGTLIDFVVKEVRKGGGGTTLSLLEEMKMVLDEDAEGFVLGLYGKMAEMVTG